MRTLFDAVAVLAFFAAFQWSLMGCVLHFAKTLGKDTTGPWLTVARWWAELRPFYLPSLTVLAMDTTIRHEWDGWNVLFAVLSLCNWWLFKDIDDDDRWKRRKAKLAEKIERRGARLVAVPVRSS